MRRLLNININIVFTFFAVEVEVEYKNHEKKIQDLKMKKNNKK